jgi:hypothetical protein
VGVQNSLSEWASKGGREPQYTPNFSLAQPPIRLFTVRPLGKPTFL